MLAKLAENIRRSRRYPPLICRRLPDGRYQILDGEHRWRLLGELGETGAWCVVWDVSDEDALILLATLNRLHGEDVPAKRSALIAELEHHQTLAELARLLPEPEAELQSMLELLDFDIEEVIARLTEEAERAAASGPRLFSFAVDLEDAPRVEQAIQQAIDALDGSNRRGRALVVLAARYLEEAE